MSTSLTTNKKLTVAAEQICETMNTELQDVYRHVRDRFQKIISHDMRARFELGEILLSVLNDTAKYGDGAMEKLAMAMGGNVTDFYVLTQLVETWTWDQISETMRLAEANGNTITYSHWRSLVTAIDPRKRNALTQRAAKEGLTVRQLGELLQSTQATKRSAAGVKPKNPVAILKQLSRSTTAVLAGNYGGGTLAPQLMQLSAERCDETMIQALDEAIQSQQSLLDFAQQNINELETAANRMRCIARDTQMRDRPSRRHKEPEVTQ